MLEKVVSRVWDICNDFPCLFPGSWGVHVLEGGQRSIQWFFLFLLSSLLQSVPIVFCGSSEPDCDGCAQDRFDDCGVELAQQLLWQTIFLQLPKKVHLLLGLFWGWSRWLSPTSGHRKLLFPEMWRSPLLTLGCWISKSSAEGCLLKSAVFSVRLSPAALMSLSTPRGSLRGPPTGKHSQWAEVAPS